jgi:hypothetical protein
MNIGIYKHLPTHLHLEPRSECNARGLQCSRTFKTTTKTHSGLPITKWNADDLKKVLSDLFFKSVKNNLERYVQVVKVPNLTLQSLLKKYNVFKIIDYVALVIEGIKYEVLKVFPFDEYTILALSVENSTNFQEFLENNGFVRVKNPFCKKFHEHHYINKIIIDEYPYEK